MATYNWSYKPGVPNKYGIVIEDGADDVRPSNACYIAMFGNDGKGNGSRMNPVKTIEEAQLRGWSGYYVVGSGVYRTGGLYYEGFHLIGDGDVVVDGTLVSLSFGDSLRSCYNIKWKGFVSLQAGSDYFVNKFVECVFDGVSPGAKHNGSHRNVVLFSSCIIKDTYCYINDSVKFRSFENLTYWRTNIVFDFYNLPEKNALNKIIFSECNIHFFNSPKYIDYSIFHNCNFKFGGDFFSPNSFPNYPFIPADYTKIDDIYDLRAAISHQFGETLLLNCNVINPKFNNKDINDFSLSFDSPAKNFSYEGSYIGAKSIGYAIKAKTIGGDFDLSTNQNFNIADDSITLTNPALEGAIESNVIPNLIARELATAPVYGFYADRNGQYLDATEDLSTATISVGANLNSNTPYLVENAAITYNGAVIQPGERFTTTAVLSFVSAGNGSCREILEAPQRHTILARFSDGDTVLSSGTALAVGHWYYANGTVNYEGVAYTDQAFKANTANPFTGNGNVTLAMGNETYQHYEPGIKLTSNNAGDVRTGAIIRGNGDLLYERGLSKEFPINARFIQFKYIIKVNNLKP